MVRNFVAIFTVVLFIGSNAFAQSEVNYFFIVAGHTYGAHARNTLGLHPPFMKKLTSDKDSSIFALFLTGDLVNQSTQASWDQVKTDLASLAIPSYYIMGNHDINRYGYAAFNEKHGGTFYSFYHQRDLFIILNSTKKDRSISSDQIDFLKGVLTSTGNDTKRVFIFFHELLWNSDIKYKGMMSNSRSRYDQMISYSNFWGDIFPTLNTDQKRKYYLMAGDVGGNTDAVSAFYDTRENVTFVASGMGEVADENYLKVDVSVDTVQFAFIPLSDTITMHPVQFYNVPVKPDNIVGPEEIVPGSIDITYQTVEIFNATSYRWKLPKGVSGTSIGNSIQVDFSSDYKYDTIKVYAVNNRYGESDPFELPVKAEGYNSVPVNGANPLFEMIIIPNCGEITIQIKNKERQSMNLFIFDLQGKCLYSERFLMPEGISNRKLDLYPIDPGTYLLQLSSGNFCHVEKIQILQ
jgi:hypothetical protein